MATAKNLKVDFARMMATTAGNSEAQGYWANLMAGAAKAAPTRVAGSEIHTAHATHAATPVAAAGGFILIRGFSDHRFGRDHQAGRCSRSCRCLA